MLEICAQDTHTITGSVSEPVNCDNHACMYSRYLFCSWRNGFFL